MKEKGKDDQRYVIKTKLNEIFITILLRTDYYTVTLFTSIT